MKKYILMTLVIVFTLASTGSAEARNPEPRRVYAELVGISTGLFKFGKNVKVTVDLGQYQSSMKNYTLQDENGKDITFNSMVAAMNYMGECGWKFVQTYIETSNDRQIHHWLLYKDISSPAEIMEGLRVKHVD